MLTGLVYLEHFSLNVFVGKCLQFPMRRPGRMYITWRHYDVTIKLRRYVIPSKVRMFVSHGNLTLIKVTYICLEIPTAPKLCPLRMVDLNSSRSLLIYRVFQIRPVINFMVIREVILSKTLLIFPAFVELWRVQNVNRETTAIVIIRWICFMRYRYILQCSQCHPLF